MLSDVSVSDEQNSPTEYIATLDFHFRADSVRQFLMASGLPYTDEQSEAIAVVPKYLGPEDGSDGAAALARSLGRPRPRACPDADQADEPGASATDDVFRALAKGQSRAYGIIEGEADADRVVVALAEPVEDGTKLRVSLIGKDRVGLDPAGPDLYRPGWRPRLHGRDGRDHRPRVSSKGAGSGSRRGRDSARAPRELWARTARLLGSARRRDLWPAPTAGRAAAASASARSSRAWATGNRSAAASVPFLACRPSRSARCRRARPM